MMKASIHFLISLGTFFVADVSARNNMSVLLLIVDDLRPEIGRYAGADNAYNPDVITPNMDALSENGVTFRNAFTAVRKI